MLIVSLRLVSTALLCLLCFLFLVALVDGSRCNGHRVPTQTTARGHLLLAKSLVRPESHLLLQKESTLTLLRPPVWGTSSRAAIAVGGDLFGCLRVLSGVSLGIMSCVDLVSIHMSAWISCHLLDVHPMYWIIYTPSVPLVCACLSALVVQEEAL